MHSLGLKSKKSWAVEMNGDSETKSSFTFLMTKKEEVVWVTASKIVEDISHCFGNDKDH